MVLDRTLVLLASVGTLFAAASSAASSQVAASAGATTAAPAPRAEAVPESLPVEMRDDSGRVTLRAVRLDAPLVLDGKIDEPIYKQTPPIQGFIQQVPVEGAPASETTHAWILFDDANFYFSGRFYDSHPERIIANEMRRDSVNIFNGGDSITLILDTFHDRRNGFLFQTNPLGALRDQAVADGQYIESWNAIWQVKSARFEGGWSTEMMIPFKSLRYRSNGPQTWGINFRRVIRSKNEFSGVTPMPAAFGPSGLAQMQVAATLEGLVTPARSRNVELKPYVVATSTTDLTSATPFRNDPAADAGVDFKYGLSRSLTADITINTDFAQIEEDLQQINLTRFNLLFPEKRDFFLEGQGIFAFGGRGLSGRGQGDTDDVPIMFFSRQVGLARGQTIPVLGGGRVTGKAGPYDIAALNIQTDERASAGVSTTNFSAVRLRRDILRRSNIGLIATARRASGAGESANVAFGADASFRLSPNNTVLGYFAGTDTPAATTRALSYRARYDFAGDRYGLGVEHLLVDPDFLPAVGYTRRENFRRSLATARFSPRLRRSRTMRRIITQATFDYVTDATSSRIQNRAIDGAVGIEFHNGDQATLQFTDEYERLPFNFRIAPGVTVPTGSYQNHNVLAQYSLANQHLVAGRFWVSTGRLYDGTRREASYSGRVAIVPQFAVEPSVSLAWVELPFGNFNARILASRFTYTPTARLFVSSLVQLNVDARTLNSSIRFRWEYRPGSDFFVVYSDGRDTAPLGPDLLNRSFAIKFTRLMRF